MDFYETQKKYRNKKIKFISSFIIKFFLIILAFVFGWRFGVSENEYCNLDCEVSHHEPYTSLTDSSDGYTFYKRYAHILNKILKNKGIAVFEISHFFSQQKLMQIFHNFSNINFHKDLNGDYRALSIIND